MKIAIVSDLHSELPNPNLFQGCEALIINGDLCPDWRLPVPEVVIGQVKWLETKFNPWVKSCGFNKDNVYVIPGNHDISFQESRRLVEETLHGKVIINQPFELNSAKFWGTPYTFKPSHYGKHWAFGLSEESLWDSYCIIPKDVNYICSHTPPQGILDCGFSSKKMMNFGSHSFRKWLEEEIVNYSSLKAMFFGHIHHHGGHKIKWNYLDKVGFMQTVMLHSVCCLDDGFCLNKRPTIWEL